MNQHPEMINDGIKIDSVYGSFPNAIWNGGRTCLGFADATNVKNTLEYFNSRGISCRYTFTNSLLEEKHLNDTWCNFLMDAANNGKNAIILASPILEEYCKENYSGFERISSTTKCLRTVEQFNEDLKSDYSFCVLCCDINNDMDSLKKISDPSRTEIVVNEYCEYKCALRERHYHAMSEAQLNFHNVNFPMTCHLDTYADIMKRKHYISYDDIVSIYAPMGFTHFKIVGRFANRENLVESYIQYFIKPEFQITARLILNSTK